MTEVGRFFDAVSYGEGDQAEVQARMARDGVIIGVGAELAVTAGGVGFVSLGTGEAFIQGFWYKNDAPKLMAVTSNVTGVTRVDLVVLHLDRTGNALVAIIKDGTLGGAVPTPTQIVGGVWELPIATLSTTSSVTTITDIRVWQPNVINPMTTPGDLIVGGVAGIPTRKPKGANGSFLGVDGAGNVNYSVPIGFANPMTTPGDIIMGAGSGVATRQAKGANNSIFGVNAAGVVGYFTDLDDVIAAGTINGNRLQGSSVSPSAIIPGSAYSIVGTNSAGTPTQSNDPNTFIDVNKLNGNRLLGSSVTWNELYNVSNIYGAATSRPYTGGGASTNPAIGGSAFYQFTDPTWSISMPFSGDVLIIANDTYVETGSPGTIVHLYVAIIGVTGWTVCAQSAPNAAGGRYSLGGSVWVFAVPAGNWAVNMAADGNNSGSTITHVAAGRSLTVFARYR